MSAKILALGEVLWDLFPSGRQLGGAPANFTYHCLNQGADARIITRVGADDLGREAIELLREAGLPVDDIQVDHERPTGTVEVAVDAAGQPRFTIRPDVAWDRIEVSEEAERHAREADAICFGSLAQRCEESRQAIQGLVRLARPGALRVFDVNLRPPFVDTAVVEASVQMADVLKLNDQELPELARMFGLPLGEREGVEAIACRFGLDLVALTRGSEGSLLWANGAWSNTAGRPVQVVDTVGAGDAFTAALVVGWLSRLPLETLHQQASALAAFVCTHAGAMPKVPHSLRLVNPREGT